MGVASLRVFLSLSLVFVVVDGHLFERYYGQSLLGFLNATWRLKDGFSPVKIILNVLDGNSTASSVCVQDLRKFKASLEQLEMSAVQMADSSGGVLPGSLTGNLINLGSYDQCLSASGEYCTLRITLPGAQHQDLSFVPHNAPILQTICVPSSCAPEDVESLIRIVDFGSEMSFSVTCQKPPPTWGPLEICGAVLFSVFILSTVAGTIYDIYWSEDYESYSGLWCSFSLKRNLKTLKTQQKDKFSCLDGIRTISQFTVIFYHVWRDNLKYDVPVLNKFIENEFLRSWRGAPIAAAPLIVDTFTVVSGFMVTYSMIGKEGKKKIIPKLLINRFMRLYPAYIIGLVLMLTLAGMMCDGPLCDRIIYKRQDICKEVWWTNVLTIQNIYPGLTKSCMSHTWFVAADWQLYLFLSPLILVGLRESRAITICAIVGAGVGAMVTVFTLTVINNLRTDTLWFDTEGDAVTYYNLLYTEPYSRLPPWCIGLLFGMLMHYHKRNRIIMKREHVLVVWGLFGVLMPATMYVILPFQLDSYSSTNSIEAGLYNSLSRPLWSVGICWVIFACSAGYGGLINDFLSGGPFPLLAKLCYSAYIIHKLVVNLYFSNIRTPIYLSPLQQATTIIGLISLSFMAAFVFYLIAEAPFIHIAKFIQQGAARSDREQTLSVESSDNQRNTNHADGLDTLELGRTSHPPEI